MSYGLGFVDCVCDCMRLLKSLGICALCAIHCVVPYVFICLLFVCVCLLIGECAR